MTKYLTFPIVLFKDAINDIREATNNAMYYCLYDYCMAKDGTFDNLIEQAEKYYGINFSNKKSAYNTGEILFNSIPGNSPKTSISKDIILDFCLNYKKDFEIISFIGFAAIRSILQKQPYTKITNEYLIGRMAGNNKADEPIPEKLFKYYNRYQLDKIKKELELNWGLKLYGHHTRGFYVSFSMDITDLIIGAESKRKSYKMRQLKRTKEDARQAVLRSMNSNNT